MIYLYYDLCLFQNVLLYILIYGILYKLKDLFFVIQFITLFSLIINFFAYFTYLLDYYYYKH